MNYGLCDLSIVGIRSEPSDKSELISQILYGECFKLIEKQKKWSRIKLFYDDYEGWIDNKQYRNIDEKTYIEITNQTELFSSDLISFVTKNNQLQPIVLGSILNSCSYLKNEYNGGEINVKKITREQILKIAMLYINSPYLWGGKTPFGIDCSGFTQMVYRLNRIKLNRDASQQAIQGKLVQYNLEREAGDLAFFQNESGKIIHVGILFEKNKIIHAHGKVRIDLLDDNGIYNIDSKNYTHKLKFVKTHF